MSGNNGGRLRLGRWAPFVASESAQTCDGDCKTRTGFWCLDCLEEEAEADAKRREARRRKA